MKKHSNGKEYLVWQGSGKGKARSVAARRLWHHTELVYSF